MRDAAWQYMARAGEAPRKRIGAGHEADKRQEGCTKVRGHGQTRGHEWVDMAGQGKTIQIYIVCTCFFFGVTSAMQVTRHLYKQGRLENMSAPIQSSPKQARQQ